MGQTSSQLGPPQIEVAAMVMADSGSVAKRKSKRSKKILTEIEEPLDQEQESARALIQLAQGSIGQTRVPVYEDDTPISTRRRVSSPKHHYGPNMTSQEIIARKSQEVSSDDRARRARKRQKKDEVSKVLAGLEIVGAQEVDQNQPSTPPGQRDQTPSDEEGVPIQRSSHPLDDVSTDDEVEIIAQGTQEVAQTQEADHPMNEPSQPNLGAPNEESQNLQAGLPSYSNSQRTRAFDQAIRENQSGKRKRKRTTERDTDPAYLDPSVTDVTQAWAEQVIDPQVPLDTAIGQYELDVHSGFKNSLCHGQLDSADLFGNNQGTDMPIDPILHSMDARAPTADMFRTNGQDSLQPQTIDLTAEKPRKRRRIHEIQDAIPTHNGHEEEMRYYSPYAGLEQHQNSQQYGEPTNGDVQTQIPIQTGSPYVALSAPIDDLPFGDAEVHSQRRPIENSKKSNQKHGNGNANGSEHFGAAEITQIETLRSDWCRTNNKRERDFNDVIQANIRGNPQAVALFNEIQEIFPDHRRSYIQRFCRRKFHNFSARGVWSPEDDELLRRAVAEKGTQWKQVGEMIERFPEDCRDRWRNYLVNPEHRNREQWTESEVLNLASAIIDCMQSMKDERRRLREEKFGLDAPMSESESDQERKDMKLINWQAVSDRMGTYGGGRSRLQCSFKWSKIKQDDRDRYMSDVLASRRGLNVAFPSDNTTKSAGWRMKQAMKRVVHMLGGDRFDLLQAILNCGAPTEGNIPWKTIGEEWWQGRWSTIERKAAWLMMKSSLPDSEGMDYRDAVYKLLNPLIESGIQERCDPSTFQQVLKPRKIKGVSESKQKEKIERRRRRRENQERENAAKRRSKEIENGIKSREFVDDSNDENDDVDYGPEYRNGNVPEDHNRFDPLLTPGSKARDHEGDIEASEAVGLGEGSADERDSLFDEPEEEQLGRPVEMNGNVNQELARQVLSLKDVV